MSKMTDGASMGVSTGLRALIESLRQVTFPGEIDLVLKQLAVNYGLNHAAFVVMNEAPNEHRLPLVHHSTYPGGWIKTYISNSYFDRDPVIKAFHNASLPYDWSGLLSEVRDARDFFSHARSFGIGRQGMSVPVRGTHGERSLFSVNSDASKDAWRELRTLAMFDWFVFAYFLHETVFNATGLRQAREKPRLSMREWQCLQLITRGMLIKQIAASARISESAVRQYLRSAKRKLRAKTLSEAAAIAAFLEITEPLGAK